MPNKAPWARVSPKKANRRHTTKLPKGPAVAATPKPANKGNNHQLIMLMFLVRIALFLIDVIAFFTAFNMTIDTMFVVVVVGIVSQLWGDFTYGGERRKWVTVLMTTLITEE